MKIFDLCKREGYNLAVPVTVLDELKDDVEIFKKIQNNNYFEIIHDINPDCIDYLERRYPNLHRGELGVICCGLFKQKNNNRYICIIDDRIAKSIGEHKGLKIAGTLGLLIWLKKSKHLSNKECQYIYDKLLNSRFRLNSKLLGKLLNDN
jgi:predicted nucleic acid-binding protein